MRPGVELSIGSLSKGWQAWPGEPRNGHCQATGFGIAGDTLRH